MSDCGADIDKRVAGLASGLNLGSDPCRLSGWFSPTNSFVFILRKGLSGCAPTLWSSLGSRTRRKNSVALYRTHSRLIHVVQTFQWK
jgi:hypothetical protein